MFSELLFVVALRACITATYENNNVQIVKKQANYKKTSSLIGQHMRKVQVVHNFPALLRTSQRHESQTSVTTGLPI